MAQIVCIASGTHRAGLNNINDVIAVHDDNVHLGPAYSTMRIVKVEGFTAKEVTDKLASLLPQLATIHRTVAPSDTWSFVVPQWKRVWKNSLNKWCFLEKKPKYVQNMNLTQAEFDAISDLETSRNSKLAILSKCRENINIDSLNLTEVVELNR